MSSGNSLYIIGTLLCDLGEQTSLTEIWRVVGNIGRAGILFLICPPKLKQRDVDLERQMAINYYTYNRKLKNHFKQTSIHLSFTGYNIPFITKAN